MPSRGYDSHYDRDGYLQGSVQRETPQLNPPTVDMSPKQTVQGVRVPDGVAVLPTARAGDSLRQKYMDHLRFQFETGFIDQVEFNARNEIAAEAKTAIELQVLIADLENFAVEKEPEPSWPKKLLKVFLEQWKDDGPLKYFAMLFSFLSAIGLAVFPAVALLNGVSNASGLRDAAGAFFIFLGVVWAVLTIGWFAVTVDG
jgi:hypothetical protein